MAAAAAAAAATTGGLLSLTPHAPTSSIAFPFLGTSYGRHSRRQLRLCPLLAASSVAAGEASYTEPEEALLEALVGVQGRGRAVAPRQLQEVESAVQTLEALQGVPDPTNSSLIEGSWKLIFTTRPGTASPIQRTFVGVDSFRVFQEVYLRTDDPRVVNVVRFSEAVGELAVQVSHADGVLLSGRGGKGECQIDVVRCVAACLPAGLGGEGVRSCDMPFLSSFEGSVFVLWRCSKVDKFCVAILSGQPWWRGGSLRWSCFRLLQSTLFFAKEVLRSCSCRIFDTDLAVSLLESSKAGDFCRRHRPASASNGRWAALIQVRSFQPPVWRPSWSFFPEYASPHHQVVRPRWWRGSRRWRLRLGGKEEGPDCVSTRSFEVLFAFSQGYTVFCHFFQGLVCKLYPPTSI